MTKEDVDRINKPSIAIRVRWWLKRFAREVWLLIKLVLKLALAVVMLPVILVVMINDIKNRRG
uniref:hypothetical protein n=1 Tax=Candidatus Thiodubiliella endoseptemdiera TaxID=2738886 RepID=UPI0034DF9C84